jgi:hypothetical protein
LDTKRKRELCDQLRTIQRYATDTARAPFPKLSREKTRARILVFSRDARADEPPPTARRVTSRRLSLTTPLFVRAFRSTRALLHD